VYRVQNTRRTAYSYSEHVWNADIQHSAPWQCASAELLVLQHCWSISTGSCLTTLLMALFSLHATTNSFLPSLKN
jgi:hypothetical protein